MRRATLVDKTGDAAPSTCSEVVITLPAENYKPRPRSPNVIKGH